MSKHTGEAATQHIPDYGETKQMNEQLPPDLSLQRHNAMVKQMAILQFQNRCLKQEAAQLRQAGTTSSGTTATTTPPIEKSKLRAKPAAAAAVLPSPTPSSMNLHQDGQVNHHHDLLPIMHLPPPINKATSPSKKTKRRKRISSSPSLPTT